MPKKGYKQSDIHKKRLSKSCTGKKRSILFSEKMRTINLGRKQSDITRKKISLFRLGKPRTEETRKKLSKFRKGTKVSEEIKEKIRNSTSKENHYNWKGGKSFELYGFKWDDLLRHSIRTRDCFVCNICKKNGYIVHHIDYNKQNCNPNNLITLCRSCHAKTNFNRDKWIKYFIENLK